MPHHRSRPRSLLTERLRAPALPPGVVMTITVVFAALTITRGVEWATDPEPTTVSAVMLDNGVGLTTWGVGLAAAGAWLLAAYIARRHFLVWAGHGLLAALYAGIALTTLTEVLDYGGGVVNLVPPVGAVVWHGVLIKILRPFPPRPHHSSEVLR